MIYRPFSFVATLAALGGASLALAQAPVVAQSPAALKTAPAKKAWTAPRTPDGKPDLQGVWTNNTATPLERPKELAGKEFFTEAELEENQKKEHSRVESNEEEGRPTQPGTAEDVHYDFSQYALDRGQTKLVWNRRTSLIVGPEGTIPPMTPEARKRVSERIAKNRGHEFDGPENQPLGARCLARANVGPPLLPTAYNSNLEIVQSPGYVAIETEMIHDVRMVPTDGRPHIAKNIRQWMGDSVGHWEGNTLVVDSTNFTDLNPFPGAQNLHVVERFTRVDGDTILYQFTVEDPGMWTKPWSGEMPITKIPGQLYEFACHEGNYALADILRGARVAEADAAKKQAK